MLNSGYAARYCMYTRFKKAAYHTIIMVFGLLALLPLAALFLYHSPTVSVLYGGRSIDLQVTIPYDNQFEISTLGNAELLKEIEGQSLRTQFDIITTGRPVPLRAATKNGKIKLLLPRECKTYFTFFGIPLFAGAPYAGAGLEITEGGRKIRRLYWQEIENLPRDTEGIFQLDLHSR